MTALEKGPRELLSRSVAARPAVMQSLGPARVRNAILASRDQSAAMSMMLQPTATLDVPAIIHDFQAIADGRISPLLAWEKHPAGVGLLAAAGLFLLLLLRRLLKPRRPRAPTSTTPPAASQSA
jgi:hypothetical protein